MVHIGNKEVPDNKIILVALTYIYGIGKTRAQEIINDTKIEYKKKVNSLSLEEIKLINDKIKQFPTD